MGFISAFLTETITIEPYERFGGGEILYGPPEERPCRIQPIPETKIVYKNPSGSLVETVAAALIFCEGEEIPVNSKITCKGHEHRVIKCALMRGFGQHHLEVTID